MRLLAYMVENGDLVILRGNPRRVKAVRTERQLNGRDDVIMEFEDGRPLRLDAEDTISVRLSSRAGRSTICGPAGDSGPGRSSPVASP
ncbi:hypothetical protein AB0A70_22275 [Streptomyces morookaense]|uniref:hypothetical protein n=1 Tax=Streptomyces morookaense TaxID=1970 RepID=UPI0034110B8C